jgi:uncharacterized protein YaiE (UPF0345 family)
MLDVNEYFDGKVKSIAFKTETLPATVGVMAPGEYVFNTADKEEITVISGALTIKRPDDSEEKTFNAGDVFKVNANSAFDVIVATETAYLCVYG